MPDPFQNVSAAGPEFIEVFARQLEVRAAEPAMVAIVEAYLDDLPWDAVGLAVEVGCGTGPTARRMAARSAHTRVLGIEPSPELLTHARRLAEGIDNLTFETGDGAALPLDDGTVDAIVFHTVLCHVVAPAELLTEAMRVLRPGGTLVVCDADFSKASLAGFDFDPLQACADFFVANYVTDRYLVAKLRTLAKAAGFHLKHFRITSRAVTDADGMLVWVTPRQRHDARARRNRAATRGRAGRRVSAPQGGGHALRSSAIRYADRDEGGLRASPRLRNETLLLCHFASAGQPVARAGLASLGDLRNRNETAYFADVTGKAPRSAPRHTLRAGKDPRIQRVGLRSSGQDREAASCVARASPDHAENLERNPISLDRSRLRRSSWRIRRG